MYNRKIKKMYSMAILLIMWLIIISYIFWIITPIFWIFLTSFKIRRDILTPLKFIFMPTLNNYKWVISRANFIPAIQGSIIVAISSTMLSLIIGSPAAYSLARFKIPRKSDIEFWILTTRMLPPVSVIIPYYMLWRILNMYDTYFALTLMHSIINLPLVIWLLNSYFRQVPFEYEEAALVDGCSKIKAFFKVTIPISLPGLAVASLLAFLNSWNEYFFAFVIMSSKQTLPIAISSFALYGLEIKYGEVAAACCIAMLPGLILAIFLRKYILQGFLAGTYLKA